MKFDYIEDSNVIQQTFRNASPSKQYLEERDRLGMFLVGIFRAYKMADPVATVRYIAEGKMNMKYEELLEVGKRFAKENISRVSNDY